MTPAIIDDVRGFWMKVALGLKDELVVRGKRIDELEAQVRDRAWTPLPNGYNTGRIGAYEIQIGIDSGKLHIFNVNKNRACWTIDLPPGYAICKLTPDAETEPSP